MSTRPIPDALLERYLAGDLPPERKAELDARLAADPAERARVDALRADSAAFFVKHPPGPTVAKLSAPAKSRWWMWLLAPLAAAAATVLFVLQRPVDVEPDIGLKGDLAVAVYRQSETGQGERLEPGAALKAGDRVRFEVRTGKDGWVAVVSRDGAGRVSTYYPYDGVAAARYSANEALLPGAIGLDDTKGAEEVWVLFSAKPFTVTAYVEALQKGGVPDFSGVTATRVTWMKN